MFLSLSSLIESQLRDAYAARYADGLDTQSTIAAKLGVNRSVVNRRLTGKANMTIETISDMIWALGQCMEVEIFNPYERPSNAARIISEHARPKGKTTSGSTSITPARIEYDG